MLERIQKKIKATREELIRYWTYLEYFELCERCSNCCSCWSHGGTVYHPEIIKKVCKNKNIKTVISRLEQMKKGKPLGYFALTSVDILEITHKKVWGKRR